MDIEVHEASNNFYSITGLNNNRRDLEAKNILFKDEQNELYDLRKLCSLHNEQQPTLLRVCQNNGQFRSRSQRELIQNQ